MVKIVVDAYGGDHAPEEIVKGCTDALKRESDVSLVLTGDETKLAQLCAEYGCDASRVEIVHAPDVIGNEDVPTVAIRKKSDSSLVRALRRAKEDDEVIGMVSAGSTGAFLAGSLLIIGRLKSVMRPALAPLLPTVVKGQKVLLLDCGANTDCKAEYLAQFALMGDAYMRSVCKIECPRIALLSNGTEDKKGCRLTQDAFKILKQLPINFVGNMEARDVNSGKYDVVVADGFYGNICLKSIEGAVKLVFKSLMHEVRSSFRAKLGALMMKPVFKKMKQNLDYTQYGGAIFLGCNKVVVKAHGSAKSETISAAISQVKEMYGDHASAAIEEAISDVDWENLYA